MGPRDGLQAEEPVAPKQRAALVDALAEAGLQEIEAVSFVSPRAVPAMAGAAEVMAALRRKPTVRYLALVPNRKGAELALEADVDGLTVTVSASPVYSERNVHMTIDQSVSAVAEVTELVAPRALPVDAVVSCAFGSPYEGAIAPVEVNRLGERLKEVGATSLTFADT
ncbi:MAG TPA: hydroxymethylglutaryl-CoA lyase, partial [Acidimicrobiia bacterium]|nr:hydroxymethylglutaryl-CoA lyase [Acidimicrobiia bacterium]